jgi:hypothetical protein
MSAELSPRDLIVVNWYLKEVVGNKDQVRTPEVVFVYTKALIEVASADGVLDENELKGIVGFAASCSKCF